MAESLFNAPAIGNHVWLENERVDHGPIDGPKTTIPGKNLGTVIDMEKPYMTMDQLLYVVKWNSGHITKHYYTELFCIGTATSTIEFFELIAKCRSPILQQGPRGGFRKFSACIEVDGTQRLISYFKDQGTFYRAVIEPILLKNSVVVQIETIR